MKKICIAIDGPSGAGKSTMAKLIAKKFSLVYVDTGALYRAIGYYALKQNISSKDLEQVTALLPFIKIELRYLNKAQHVYLNDVDITGEIRTPEVSTYASDVSAMPPVRAFLLALQKDIAKKGNVIMDGRDIGTVIMPNADLKIFLTASSEDRAKRRFNELKAKGMDVTFDTVYEDLKKRDKNDSERAEAPLKPALDAVILDTTGFELEKTLKVIETLVCERLSYDL